MKTAMLAIICVCVVAQTVGYYETEEGGIGIYFGNFGYYYGDD